ncbi:pseudouridine kinase [Caloramator quimbayensis]|uniref:Pseudouridine kinase n=1 Tax=Caloramator quimbayensis TaxID=1147123 RepID=A0A1T4YAB0_9CLOT|nr:carbohydrate kinase family protein [Caloramator quimbayensis]SKA98241.1 pseudouridine kinase [Caloramator quimbayensis]
MEKRCIINNNDYVLVLGGANVDIQGVPKDKLILRDSNIGTINISLGGVARNIAENLSRLGVYVKLLTAVGDDLYGNKILEHCKDLKIDVSDVIVSKKHSTSTYLSILDEKKDMAVALSCMDICEEITIDYIKSKENIFKNSKICIADTNLSREVLEYITQIKDVNIFLDTVSTSKAQRVKDFIGRLHTIKPNRYEAQVLTGISVDSVDNAKRACEYLLNKGVKRVFLSLGEEGALCAGQEFNMFKIDMQKIKVVNATGAGDAFLAGLAFASIKCMDITECAKFAMSCAAIALLSENTISDEMSVENVYKKMKEMELCLKNI